MEPESIRYWLQLVIGVPMACVFASLVILLGHLARRGECPLTLRAISISIVLTACALVLAFGALTAVSPTWLQPWMAQLPFLGIVLCFVAQLACLTWSRNPPKSPEERRRVIGMTLAVGSLVVVAFVTSM